MDPEDPEKRIAELERQLAEQRRFAQPELRQDGAVVYPQPAVSVEPGSEKRTKARGRGIGITALGWGLVYVITEMCTPNSRDTPNWVFPAYGVVLVGLGVLTGRAGHGWSCFWVGVALLAVSAIYLGFKWVRMSVRKPRDPRQSTSGRHSAG
jgi:hypothetical protein